MGKTTAIREFSKAHYEHLIEVNFVKHPMAAKAFDGDLTTRTIITNLSAMGFGPFVEGKTLVFFDEIQECPNARTAIKFLVEDHLFDYIESGSLLGINYKPVPSYPVGYEERYDVYPLDFEEFLWAKGVSDDVIELIKKSYRQLFPVPEFIHQQISRYYREYLVVGGMPEAVQTFVTKTDFNEVVKVQRSIMTTYRADITSYAGKMAPLVKRVFDAMPSALGKQDKRFVLSDIEKGASLRKYEDPTQWLIDAGIAYFSYNTHDLLLPFEQYEKRNLYKVFLLDTGLLCSMWREPIQWQVLQGSIDINEGALTENFVAAELVRKGYTLHYYDRKSRQELDFLIARGNKMDILEVKSGNDYKNHASLDTAIQNPNALIGETLVLCKFPMQTDGNIQYIPLYALGWI